MCFFFFSSSVHLKKAASLESFKQTLSSTNGHSGGHNSIREKMKKKKLTKRRRKQKKNQDTKISIAKRFWEGEHKTPQIDLPAGGKDEGKRMERRRWNVRSSRGSRCPRAIISCAGEAGGRWTALRVPAETSLWAERPSVRRLREKARS